MEHIDALEAVRRLTLERDALAEQVKRLEEGLKWETDCKDRAWQAAFRFDAENYLLAEQVKLLKEQNAPQAPERRERHETDAETGEGGNGAPLGYNAPSWGKIARDVIWCASLALQNEIRLADTRKDWDELRRLQKGKMALDRIRDELSAH